MTYSRDSSKKPTIVLIPGIYENWYFMRPVADRLYVQGYDIRVVEALKYNIGPIEDVAAKVAAFMHREKIAKCILVTHSKGGLVGKYLLANYNERAHIQGMIAINTPFSGSIYAYLLPFKGVRIFRPHSPLLTVLAANAIVNEHITSIYSSFDPHIPAGSYLAHARNIQVAPQGHYRLLSDKNVLECVELEVQRLARSNDE